MRPDEVTKKMTIIPTGRYFTKWGVFNAKKSLSCPSVDDSCVGRDQSGTYCSANLPGSYFTCPGAYATMRSCPRGTACYANALPGTTLPGVNAEVASPSPTVVCMDNTTCPTSLIRTTSCSGSLPNIDGSGCVPDKKCHFPFTYAGNTYCDCTSDGYHTPWCYQEEEITGSDGVVVKQQGRSWGVCTNANTGPSQPVDNVDVPSCAFPFNYKGLSFFDCTNLDGCSRRQHQLFRFNPGELMPAADAGHYSVPACADMDGDGDFDCIVGEAYAGLKYFKNVGTRSNPLYTEQTGAFNPFDGMRFGSYFSAPAFLDANGDGLQDVIVGNRDGDMRFVLNTGSATNPAFTEKFGGDNPLNGFQFHYGSDPAPTCFDMDNDGDDDCAVGAYFGGIVYFENTGSSSQAVFTLRLGSSNPFNDFDIGTFCIPACFDADGDGDLDCILGEIYGDVFFLQNDGSKAAPRFKQNFGSENPFDGVDVGMGAAPVCVDFDNDGDDDCLIGQGTGHLSYYYSTAEQSSVWNRTACAEAIPWCATGDDFQDVNDARWRWCTKPYDRSNVPAQTDA